MRPMESRLVREYRRQIRSLNRLGGMDGVMRNLLDGPSWSATNTAMRVADDYNRAIDKALGPSCALAIATEQFKPSVLPGAESAPAMRKVFESLPGRQVTEALRAITEPWEWTRKLLGLSHLQEVSAAVASPKTSEVFWD